MTIGDRFWRPAASLTAEALPRTTEGYRQNHEMHKKKIDRNLNSLNRCTELHIHIKNAKCHRSQTSNMTILNAHTTHKITEVS